jgi:hypothetical protein
VRCRERARGAFGDRSHSSPPRRVVLRDAFHANPTATTIAISKPIL